MIISPVTYDYYEISFILIVAAFSIPISRKASMVYIPAPTAVTTMPIVSSAAIFVKYFLSILGLKLCDS